MSHRTVLLALAVGVLAVAGCGEKYPRLAVVPAEGKLLYKGKPAVGAQVILTPVNDDSPDAVRPRGRVGKDGVYKLSTYPQPNGEPDGAPPGEYRVSIRWPTAPKSGDDPDEPGPPGPAGLQQDRLGERYSNPKASGLKVTIDALGKVQPAVLELK